MKFAFLLLCTAAMSLALTGCATKRNQPPDFNQLDTDGDGSLSRSEALGNPGLSARFDSIDGDRDGKLSRFEYLQDAGKRDLGKLQPSTGR